MSFSWDFAFSLPFVHSEQITIQSRQHSWTHVEHITTKHVFSLAEAVQGDIDPVQTIKC